MIYIQQAYKGKKGIWRFITTTLIVMSPFILNIIFYLLLPELFEAAIEQNGSMNSNFDLLTSLATFAFFLGLLFILVRVLHQRSVTSLITSRKKQIGKECFSLLDYGFSFQLPCLVWNIFLLQKIINGILTYILLLVWLLFL